MIDRSNLSKRFTYTLFRYKSIRRKMRKTKGCKKKEMFKKIIKNSFMLKILIKTNLLEYKRKNLRRVI